VPGHEVEGRREGGREGGREEAYLGITRRPAGIVERDGLELIFWSLQLKHVVALGQELFKLPLGKKGGREGGREGNGVRFD